MSKGIFNDECIAMCHLEELEDCHCELGADIVKYLTMKTTIILIMTWIMAEMVVLVMMILAIDSEQQTTATYLAMLMCLWAQTKLTLTDGLGHLFLMI